MQVENFLKAKNLPIRALLLLDNAPSHPPAEELVHLTKDGKIWVMYMPPNVTPLIQPMDQNAIRLLKLNYRSSLLSKITASSEDFATSLKKTDLFEAISLVAMSWEKLSTVSLKKCWKNILGDSGFDDEDDLPLSSLRDGEELRTINHCLNLLNANFANSSFSYEDLHDWNIDDPNEEIDQDTDSDDDQMLVPVNPFPKVKHEDAIKCFDTCIQWAVENNIETSKTLLLRSIHEKAVEMQLKNKTRQCLMTDFF